VAIEIPPVNCKQFDYGEDDVDVSVSGTPLADGGIGIVITITPKDSPISINIVPFPPFILPGINWDFFFGETEISREKSSIQDFFTPFMRYARDAFGYPLRDNKALYFGSNDVRRNFARCPQLAALAPQLLEDAVWLVQCQGGEKDQQGFAQRCVNQFLSTACVNQWTVEQTGDLWDAIVQAIKPLDPCPAKCLTAVQVTRYLLKGNPAAPGMQDFLCDPANWDTSVLYCFPADFPIAGCPVPKPEPEPCPEGWVRQNDGTCKPPVVVRCQPPMVEMPDGTCACPLPDPQPQPTPCPPGWIRQNDGTCKPPFDPYPQPGPTPVPQPQPCPPACQSQIDQVRECCQDITRRVTQEVIPQLSDVWQAITNIWEQLTLLWQETTNIWNRLTTELENVYQLIENIWVVLRDIDIRIDTRIENYYLTIIRPYIDEMCERCKAQPAPPPDETTETTCEEGERKWGIWAECWLRKNTPEVSEIGEGLAWCDSMTALKAACAEAALPKPQGRWAEHMEIARQAVANGLQGQFGVGALPGAEEIETRPYIFEDV
jgi:hypothetical protein